MVVDYIRPTVINYGLTTTIDNDKLIEWCNKHYTSYLKDETYTVDTISTVMIENYIDEHIDELVEIEREEIDSYIKDVELGSLTIVEE